MPENHYHTRTFTENVSINLASFFAIFLFAGSFSVQSQNMTNSDLEKIIYVVSDSIRGESGNWQFMIKGRMLACITDTTNNRLRIMSPIIEQKKLAHIDLLKLMEANFHSALDARYAISDNLLWSMYVHPLKELQKDEILSAINQVYTAALTYGTTYNSSELTFPIKKEIEEEKKQKGKM
ncbi:YbjN domain-containing protein [Aureibaculum algae]|uniref:YbjN domain-containing protein n=1 Tax=Aureibaculum algae TaxID=2584122 RepID=A0A5B7TWS4_9FLAO|nr:YbjN domain-containing protein [Aureibaculum algae]QCX39347.1 YbjN domain-containing protein [Aureibaculum algae]